MPAILPLPVGPLVTVGAIEPSREGKRVNGHLPELSLLEGHLRSYWESLFSAVPVSLSSVHPLMNTVGRA